MPGGQAVLLGSQQLWSDGVIEGHACISGGHIVTVGSQQLLGIDVADTRGVNVAVSISWAVAPTKQKTILRIILYTLFIKQL